LSGGTGAKAKRTYLNAGSGEATFRRRLGGNQHATHLSTTGEFLAPILADPVAVEVEIVIICN
jgi:hypothetical protein